MRHLVDVTLCRWPSGMQEHMLLHTRPSSTQGDINQVSHLYNNSPDDGHMAARNTYAPAYQTVIYTRWHQPGVAFVQKFSWWWTQGCPKHVEDTNKHTRKIPCVSLVIYKDHTRMHGQHNTKLLKYPLSSDVPSFWLSGPNSFVITPLYWYYYDYCYCCCCWWWWHRSSVSRLDGEYS